jgi:hypothetical protein
MFHVKHFKNKNHLATSGSPPQRAALPKIRAHTNPTFSFLQGIQGAERGTALAVSSRKARQPKRAGENRIAPGNAHAF